MAQLELWQLLVLDSSSMAGSDSMADSSVGSESEMGSKSDSMVGPSSTLLVGSVLGMQADSDSARFVIEEYFQPAILQSTEGSFQHYVC